MSFRMTLAKSSKQFNTCKVCGTWVGSKSNQTICTSTLIDIHRYSSSQSSHVWPSGYLAAVARSCSNSLRQARKAPRHGAQVQHKRSNALKHVKTEKNRFSKPWSSNRLKMWQHHVQKISCSKKHVHPICVKCTSSVPCASKFLSSYSHLATEGCPLRLCNSNRAENARKWFGRQWR